MKHSIRYIADLIKEARTAKGLSQRALSAKIGMPQSHISKIENGTVDIQISSLIEIARALDLEFMLIPRALSPAIQSILSNQEQGRSTSEPMPAYRLDEGVSDV